MMCYERFEAELSSTGLPHIIDRLRAEDAPQHALLPLSWLAISHEAAKYGKLATISQPRATNTPILAVLAASSPRVERAIDCTVSADRSLLSYAAPKWSASSKQSWRKRRRTTTRMIAGRRRPNWNPHRRGIGSLFMWYTQWHLLFGCALCHGTDSSLWLRSRGFKSLPTGKKLCLLYRQAVSNTV